MQEQILLVLDSDYETVTDLLDDAAKRAKQLRNGAISA